ncbi:hypothetical protein Tco_0883843, partial [Tanacetum coccineum]
LKQSQTSESETQTSDFDTCESDCSVETHEPTINEPKVVSQPKVCSDASIIEEYESDSEDEHVSLPTEEQETPTVLTRTGKILVSTARTSGTNNVSTARHNFNSQAVLTNTARKISTVKPFVNRLVLLGEKGKLLLSPQQVVIGDQKDITGTKSPNTMVDQDYPHRALKNKGIVDSGCSRHMTGNKAYLVEYQDFNGGPVAFGGSKGYITGKGKIKTGKLDFEDVCFVKELQHFNLFSVSQMCDKKNKVLFTDTECLVLSPEFKLPDENQVLLRNHRQNNMYSFNLENVVPSGGYSLFNSKASNAESAQDYFVLPIWSSYTSTVKSSKANNAARAAKASSTNIVNTASTPVSTASPYGGLSFTDLTNTDQMMHSEIPALEEGKFNDNPMLYFYNFILMMMRDGNLPYGKKAIGTKWVYRNKKDERGVMVRNNGKIESLVATTPIESNKPLVKDEDGVDVDVHVYRSMIGSLMYLTASRPDIMFAVCACARFQVTPKASHLNAVKRIFRYLKHQPKLGLWYPRDSPFELEAYSDSDYGGASLDRKSTTGGCQFLGRRLISWQCKKQTIVANSTTEAEYVAAANCCGQVLWIQNQMMDYGFNFMNTKIHIDNESTISVIKNPVAHSRTKHIEIRFHFIRDCYEKRLIEVIKIHTDHNVADLLTKGFDVTRFNFLVVSIGLLNLESLERDIDGTEELLLPDLLILWLTKVSTDSAKLVPLGKDSTAIKPLEKIPPRFWMSTKSKIINNVRYITAKVAGKTVNILEASIRSDLLFDDADGIDSLHNQAIFDAIQLMGTFFTPMEVLYPHNSTLSELQEDSMGSIQ